jgi:putative YhdH/YhfP family quinone oxidoreductase
MPDGHSFRIRLAVFPPQPTTLDFQPEVNMALPDSFKAFVVSETSSGDFQRSIVDRPLNALPDHDVLIEVHYSSLNYKDALSGHGNKGVTRHYPHTPGIDAAGVVAESRVAHLQAGDSVLVTGFDLGMNTSGGLGQYIRVPAQWVIPMPSGLSLKESMIYGTAGFTAAMCIHRLINHGVSPDQGEILVTGATGGVGSLAIALLSGLGYKPVAVSGKADAIPFLESLGAVSVLARDEAEAQAEKPILKARWAGVVDTVGGKILSNAIKMTRYGGAVTCCGLVASPNLSLTVFPFILRSVALYGIDSAECGRELRQVLWEKLAGDWRPAGLAALSREIGLSDVENCMARLLKGANQGRTVVKMIAG